MNKKQKYKNKIERSSNKIERSSNKIKVSYKYNIKIYGEEENRKIDK